MPKASDIVEPVHVDAIIDPNGVLMTGHHRLVALQRQGVKRVEIGGSVYAIDQFIAPEIIDCYTRRDALNEGTLIDVSATAREAGIKFPVALTATVHQQYVRVPDGVMCQDEKGRLWDIIWLFRCGAARNDVSQFEFDVIVRNHNRENLTRRDVVTLKAIIGPGDDAEPVITIMLPNED